GPSMLADDSSLSGLPHIGLATGRGRQLQHRCVLTFIKPRDQHGLSVGEFKCIVMHVRLVRVQLPEAGNLVTNYLSADPVCGKATLKLDLLLERNLGAGKEAHRHVWFSPRGKTARDRVVELRRYELVSDLCRSGRYMVQTVVAHRRHSLLGTADMVVLLREASRTLVAILCLWRNRELSRRHSGWEKI